MFKFQTRNWLHKIYMQHKRRVKWFYRKLCALKFEKYWGQIIWKAAVTFEADCSLRFVVAIFLAFLENQRDQVSAVSIGIRATHHQQPSCYLVYASRVEMPWKNSRSFVNSSLTYNNLLSHESLLLYGIIIFHHNRMLLFLWPSARKHPNLWWWGRPLCWKSISTTANYKNFNDSWQL